MYSDMKENINFDNDILKSQNLIYLIENIGDAFYSLNKQWEFVYLNARAEIVWGKKREELLGKNIWQEFPFIIDYLPACEKAIKENRIVEFEVFNINLKKWFALRLFPYDEGLSILSRDITEHKNIAKALSKSTEELKHFSYIASHDLQEPLRMITSFMELLNKNYGDKLEDTPKQYIKFAVDGAKMIQTQISDLLIYSKIETQKDEIKSFDLNKIVHNICNELSEEIKNKNITISYENLPNVNFGTKNIRLLFFHLIDNAIKFSEPNTEIEIKAFHTNDNWLFTIKDNGIGIEDKYFDKIFLPFRRLHARQLYSGNGIGLSICKKILEKYNGEIWLESQLGRGTIFYFTISDKI